MKLRRREPSGGWRRALTWAVVAIAAAAVAGEVTLQHVVDADFVARRIGSRLPPRFEVTLDRAHFSLLRGSLDLRGLELRRRERAGGPEVPRVSAPEVHLGGLDRLAPFRRGPVRVGRVRIDSPRVAVRLHALTRPAREGGRAVPPGARAGRLLPPVRIGRVRVSHATVVVTGDDGTPIDSLSGLGATLDEVTAAESGGGTGRSVSVRDAEVDLASFRHMTADGSRVLGLDSVVVSTVDSAVRVAGVRWEAPGGGGGPESSGGVTVRVHGLAARHVDFGRLVGEQALVAGRMEADSVSVRAAVRRTGQAEEGRPAPAMPGEWLGRVSVPLELDTVLADHGTVVYEETPAGSPRAGRVRFTGLRARMVGLANRAALGRRPGPTSVTATARLEGRAGVRLELSADLAADSLAADLSGGVGSMPAAALDPALAPLAGIRITAGTLDSASFDLRLRGADASGRVEALYRGLSLRKADADSTSPGLLDRIGTAILRRRVREANPPAPDRKAREGTVDHRRAEDETFWAYVWKSLRSGLLDVTVR